MRFNDYNVDIDENLRTALSSGELVIFVGAGVSAKAYPNQPRNTYYPKFRELVHEIAKRIDKTVLPNEIKMLDQGLSDRILGEWERDGYEIHDIAAEILHENEDGQRIELHKSIIHLFPEESEPRIVTTNFDNLLVRARDKEGLKDATGWKIYEAPSLPPANNDRFKGICFLHGRVTEPREIILTDRDIGRAYMDEGWALKFAHELFRNFNVLFVGYSLEDPPLRYLCLALEGKTNKEHWIMLADREKKNENEWLRRGVKPIWYPVKRNNFIALEETINDWASNNRFGFIDRRNILSRWAQTDPNQLVPHDLDRAKDYLKTQELLRDFAENNLDENWFDKLVEWGHFDFVLKSSGEFKPADNVLTQGLIRWLLEDPHNWLLKLVPFRKDMNAALFEFFCREFENSNKQYDLNTNDLRMILEFFRPLIEKDLSKAFSLWIGKILKQLLDDGAVDDAVWLFVITNHTDPNIKTTHNFSYLMAQESGKDTAGIHPLRLEVEFNHQDSRVHRSRGYIDEIFLPYIDKVGYPLLTALTIEFIGIKMALKRISEDRFLYMRRKAIETHTQNIPRFDMYNFFIDTIRDVWEALLQESPDQAIKIYKYWSEIDDEIFRRIALHAARLILEKGHVE